MAFDLDSDALDGLAAAAAAGDRSALDEFIRQCRPLVLARCRNFFPNPFDAEDAAQEALIVVTRRIGSFEGRSKATTWLYRVTTNAAIDAYRSMKRRRSVTIDAPEQADRGSTPSVIVGARIDVLEAASTMEPLLAEAVLMRDMCDLTYDQIAESLDIPLGTAKRRIHDGRQAMREAIYG